MKIFILATTLFMVIGFAAKVSAGDVKTQTTDSPVKTEMILLDSAFKNLIGSLVLNNLKDIEEPFHDVHAAREKTEEAIKKGKVVLPKNNEKMKEFIEMDEQFHRKLEALIHASRKGDMKKARQVTHDLLDACVQCHAKFRNL